MSRLQRKAEEPLSNQPAAKKARISATQPHDLKSALFTNGVPRKLNAEPSSQPHNKPQSHRVDDTKAIISKSLGHGTIPTPHVEQPEIIEISSDHSTSSDEDQDEDEEDEDQDPEAEHLPNGDTHDDTDSPTSKNDSDKENAEQPSFGDLLQSTAPIDVETLLRSNNDNNTSALTPHNPSQTTVVQLDGTTLTTVLSQALRTNDSQLLESCLRLNDLAAVRGTIARLPSTLAESLLSQLAARLHARPGRANNIMVWLQWTLVAHGGYLAGRHGLVARLGALQRAVRERAGGLAPLLQLKGRLDMLNAQMELRRAAGVEEEDDEGVVVYVEDEEVEVDGKASGSESDEAGFSMTEDAVMQDQSSDDDDSSEEEDDSESVASSKGFSDQAVEEVPSSGDDSEESSLSPEPELRKGRERRT
jgi:U3 small nucleolar RNA-associated protein 5